MDNFRNIGLIGRLGSTKVIDTLKNLIRFLDEQGLTPILDERIAGVMPGHRQQTSTQKLMGEICDLVIVVGGDGSLLGAARNLAQSNVPVLGVNRGSLGFLTDISPSEIEQKVAEVLEGKYTVDRRFLIDVVVKRNGEPIGESTG